MWPSAGDWQRETITATKYFGDCPLPPGTQLWEAFTDYHAREDRGKDKDATRFRGIRDLAEVQGPSRLIHSAFGNGSSRNSMWSPERTRSTACVVVDEADCLVPGQRSLQADAILILICKQTRGTTLRGACVIHSASLHARAWGFGKGTLFLMGTES